MHIYTETNISSLLSLLEVAGCGVSFLYLAVLPFILANCHCFSHLASVLVFGYMRPLDSRWQEPHLAKEVSVPHRNEGKLVM